MALDYSGSMGGTRIAVLKNFVAGPGGLIDTYAGVSSEMTITVILFNGGVMSNQTFSDAIIGGVINGTFGTPFTTEKSAEITVNADGSFTYEATLTMLKDAYSETFSYTIENSAGTSTSTFTISIAGAALLSSTWMANL